MRIFVSLSSEQSEGHQFTIEMEFAAGDPTVEMRRTVRELNEKIKTSVSIVKFGRVTPGGPPVVPFTVKGTKKDLIRFYAAFYEGALEGRVTEKSMISDGIVFLPVRPDSLPINSGSVASITLTGGKVSYAKFEDSYLYGEPEQNGNAITRQFDVLTAITEADQFDDGNSFAGCWLTTKRKGKIRTFVLSTKQACKPTNVKLEGLSSVVLFEVKNKEELYDGKVTIVGPVYTAKGVDALLKAM